MIPAALTSIAGVAKWLQMRSKLKKYEGLDERVRVLEAARDHAALLAELRGELGRNVP